MPLAIGVVAFTVLTVATFRIARLQIFTGFSNYDDEGYMLIALKSFLHQGSLYDDVFSQYGPFYYEAWGAFFSILGLSVDHDGGRTATLVAWLLATLILGLATWRMTRSILLGLAAQMIVFGSLVTLGHEPMHPGGIICLLLATIVAISCFVRERASPVAMGLLGGAVMALILVKINVGGFAFVALALACVVTYPALLARRWLRPLVEIGFVAIPLLLMSSKLGEGWARHYSVHVAVAALAVVIVLRTRAPGRRSAEELWWLAGGLLAVAVTICAAIIAAGTSPSGLVEGVLTQPLRQSDAFSIPLFLPDSDYLFDFLGLAAALGYWYALRRRRGAAGTAWTSTVAVLSILIGLQLALSVIGKTLFFGSITSLGHEISLLGFAWVALIAMPGEPDEGSAFARLLLVPLAVLQGLHAYPVAGSQVAWSAFLLIPIGALCVANGVRGLAFVFADRGERYALAAAGAVIAAVLMVVLVNVQLRQAWHDARFFRDNWPTFGLPGATELRIEPTEAIQYQSIVATIDSNCESLVMLPGMDSFYFWTQLEPPDGYNATGWPTLFDDAHEQRVVEAVRTEPGLCLLKNIPMAEAWSGGKIPPGPLVDYLRHGFEPIAKFGDIQILKRVPGAGGSA